MDNTPKTAMMELIEDFKAIQKDGRWTIGDCHIFVIEQSGDKPVGEKYSFDEVAQLLQKFSSSIEPCATSSDRVVIEVLDWLLEEKRLPTGIPDDFYEDKIVLIDGTYYWDSDTDGDHPMMGKDIMAIYNKLKLKSPSPTGDRDRIEELEKCLSICHDLLRDIDIYHDTHMENSKIEECVNIASKGLNELYKKYSHLLLIKE